MTSKRLILLMLPLVTFYCYALDLYVPLMPTIRSYFAVDYYLMQQSNSLFMLAIAVGQLFFGPLSDRQGRRPVLFLSLILFFFSSLLCGLTTSIAWFIVGRIGQALGACGCYLCCFATVRDLYTNSHTCTAMFGYLNVASSTSAIIAPSIGTLLGHHWGWRSIFYILSLSSLTTAVICWRAYPAKQAADSTPSQKPLIIRYWRIFCHPNFQFFTWPAAVGIASFFSIYSVSAYFYMDVLGLSKTTFSLCYGSLGLAFFIGSSLCARWVSWLGVIRTLYLGLILHLVACAVLAIDAVLVSHQLLIIQGAALWMIFAASFMVSAGIGGTMAPFQQSAGTAFALISAVKFICCYLVAEWVVSYYQQSLFSLGATLFVLNLCAWLWTAYFKNKLSHLDEPKVLDKSFQHQEVITDQIL